jgi:hypothetical protein
MEKIFGIDFTTVEKMILIANFMCYQFDWKTKTIYTDFA